MVTPPPEVPAGPTSTVQFGSTVDEAARAKVTAFIGAADSTAVSGANAFELPDSAAAVVFAVNSQGEATLGGMAEAGKTLQVDATTTAHLLVTLVLPPAPDSAVVTADAAAARRAAIEALPEFSALVAALRASSAAGEAYATEESVALAGEVVRALLAASPAPSRAGGAVLSQSQSAANGPRFVNFTDIAISETGTGFPGGEVTLKNGTFIPFAVKVGPTAAVLQRREYCFPLCWPWRVGIEPSVEVELSQDGPVQIRAEFETAARQGAILTAGVDLFAGILRLAGIKLSFADDAAAPLLGLIGTKVNAVSLLAAPTWDNALGQTKDALASAAPELASALVAAAPELAGKGAVQGVLRNLSLAIGLVDTGVWVTDRSRHYYAVSKYWSVKPETVSACLEGGDLYRACVDRIELNKESVELAPEEETTLTATLFDKNNQILTDRSDDAIRWKSDDPEAVEVDETGRTVTITAGPEPDTVTITVEAGTKKETIEVVVGVTVPGTYVLELVDGEPLPGEFDGHEVKSGHMTLTADGKFEGEFGLDDGPERIEGTYTKKGSAYSWEIDDEEDGGTFTVTGAGLTWKWFGTEFFFRRDD